MLKTSFKDKLELDIYTAEQKVKMEKGYLTKSEREKLKQIIDKPQSYIIEIKELPKDKLIITDINKLKVPCEEVKEGEDVEQIIKDLKETLMAYPTGIGLSANQIGYNKRVSYLHVPKMNEKEKKIEFIDTVLINPKITYKTGQIRLKGEGCLSIPGIKVDTNRCIFCTVEFLDEKKEKRMGIFQDLQSFAVQHEISHLNGRTIFDDKWKTK